MLIILEGPDGSGKSTLAQKIANHYDTTVCHHHAYQGLSSESLMKVFLESIIPALYSEKSHVVLDRCWISEEIYSEELRHVLPRITEWQSYRLGLITRLCKSALILCVPPYEAAFHNWNDPTRDELVKDHKDYEAVYFRYKNSQFYKPGIPTFTYDYTKDCYEGLINQLNFTVL